MKLIIELIEFALQHNMLTEAHKRKLQDDGFYTFYDSVEEYCESYEREYRECVEQEPDTSEDELDQTYNGDYYHPDKRSIGRRNRKRKSSPVGSELKVDELNKLVEDDWKKLTEEFPRLAPLWDSWKEGKLERVLADGFTLNDVYALMKVELRDYHDFSGPAPTAFRQLLRQVGNVMGKYSWVIKSQEAASMIEFHKLRQQVLEEVRKLFETDRERFATLSSQNGKLNFPLWEKAVQTDTTSMKVWTILNLPSVPVTPERIEEILTLKPELAIALQMDLDYMTNLLSNLEKRDWSSLIIITERAIDNTFLKSVIIPDGVKRIGDEAFSRCSHLTSVAIPCSVEEIGDSAFRDCVSLKSVSLPDGVEKIGERAFYCCRSLMSVAIPKGVKVIGDSAFGVCSSLTSMVIPVGVEEIGALAFSCCSSLMTVSLPEGVTAIGDSAFFGCSSLTSVVIPEGVKKIGHYAFWDCSSLTSVTLPKGVKWIGDGLFRYCSSLTSVVISDSVTEIGNDAFCGCSSLKSVVIPDSVKEIGAYAFSGCNSLTTLALPKGVTTIEDYAFLYCSSLKSVVIPESVKFIGYHAFKNCPNLTIHAPAGSYAEKYSKEHNIPFQPLEGDK